MKKIVLLAMLLATTAFAQRPAVWGPGSGGGGSGTISAGTTNTLPKYTASTTVGNSLLSDNGTTLTYTGAGGFSSQVFTGTGPHSATISLPAGTGTIDALPANSAGWVAPATGGTSYVLKPPATITAGALVVAAPATEDGVNKAVVSSVSYDTLSAAVILGTKASPNTAAGAITWTASSVLLIQTSTAAATRTYTLPAASSYTGKAVRLCIATGTGHANFQPASGAALVLNGTLLTADHYIQLAVTAAGDAISLYSDGTNWNSIGSGTAATGSWSDAASP